MRVHLLRGIQMSIADRLVMAGVPTAEALLQAGRTRAGRRELATKVGVDPQQILELVNRADLARLRGVGEIYSHLLENAGVDTVAELARRDPVSLHARLKAQVLTGDARRTPTLAQVQDWVSQAKSLGRAVEY